MNDYERLTSDDYYSIKVPNHSPEARRQAAVALAEDMYGGDARDCPGAVTWLADAAQPETYRQHTTGQSVDDAGCFCDDEGWWCPEGDGPATPFYVFGRHDFGTFERMAAAEVIAAREETLDDIFHKVWMVVGARVADDDGLRLVINPQHLAELAGNEQPPDDITTCRVFGYPIRVDAEAIGMHLERTEGAGGF